MNYYLFILNMHKHTRSILPHQPQDLPRARHGETMELKGVGAIAVCLLPIERLGQVDDVDGFKRAFFHTDPNLLCPQYIFPDEHNL